MLSLTGCLEFTEMTEEESKLVAQSAAMIILNNNRLYAEKLSTPTPTPSPSPTPTWFPTATPSPSPAPEVTQSASSTSAPTPTTKPDKEENEFAFTELKEIIGISDISLEFGGYALYDNYTFDYYSVEPSVEGNKLLIIKLVVKNNASTETNVNLAGKKLDYRLDYETGKSIKPLMTILTNDFTTLNVNVDAGARYETVLVFEVASDFEPKMLNLFIIKENKAVIVKLK